MKKTLFIISVLIILTCLFGCGKSETGTPHDTTESVNVQDETTAAETEIEGTFDIETQYAVLKYPLKWKDSVDVVVSDDKVTFSSNGTYLFDIVYNSSEGTLLGTLITDDYNVYVNVVDTDLEDETFCEMQEDINVILHNLIEDYNFIAGEKVIRADELTFKIETPVVTLKYPKRWENKVTVVVTDNSVSVSNALGNLFDLNFYECDGVLLGYYNNVPIYVVDYEVDDVMSSEMIEDINVIFSHLQEDPNFVLAK